MNISFRTFLSHTYQQVNNKTFNDIRTLQKKVAIFAFAYFSCIAFGYLFYRFYYLKNQQLPKEKRKNQKPVAHEALKHKIKIYKKEKVAKSKEIIKNALMYLTPKGKHPIEEKLAHSPILNSPCPLDIEQENPKMQIKKDEKLEALADILDIEKEDGLDIAAEVDANVKNAASPKPCEPVNDFIDQAAKKEDFLSILRCLVDHPEWVSANIKKTTAILQHFGSKPRFLQPIKVVADLYEKLLGQHDVLSSTDALKTTDVIFDDKTKYRTHLIFALKNLHIIRDIVEEELPDLAQLDEGIDMQLPGNSKALKAVLQYLDKSNLAAIDSINFFELIQIAYQYAIPSLWRYCETELENRIPFDLGKKDWEQMLQLYASMDTHNVNFVIDHLLLQRHSNFAQKNKYIEFLNSLSFDGCLDSQKIKSRILQRLDIVSANAEVVREEHEDRIINSIDIIEKLAAKLSKGQDIFDYMSCYSVNVALKILFKAAIAKQMSDESLKQRISDALLALHLKQEELVVDKTWRLIEWDSAEADAIPSLVVCLLNYLNQEIPQEIKELPYWHNESLVLAFNDESKGTKIPLSRRVIHFAENAVKKGFLDGFYFLLRPSSTRVSSKNSLIFTLTANKRLNRQNNLLHFRIEAFRDPKTQQWLFRSPDSQKEGWTLIDLITTKAAGLEVIPVLVPKTKQRRIVNYS